MAALHAITLAALHVDGKCSKSNYCYLSISLKHIVDILVGAVDMDIYGAFQLCSIGILAAPITVRKSKTYFYDPARNIIFLWTGLVLAGEPNSPPLSRYRDMLLTASSLRPGLLSLTVAFFRLEPTSCLHDDSGNPVSTDPRKFPYETTCGLRCSVDDGPFSPMRGGSANNIYVIPAPDKLSFHTATLLAAACCLPAILTMISMWNKILETNWKKRFGKRVEEERRRDDELVEGTGVTVKKLRDIDSKIRGFLRRVEISVFAAAVLAILIFGERNFFSRQLRYQTEPIASIGRLFRLASQLCILLTFHSFQGQWAPIVGTGLAALGSLYVLLIANKGLEDAKERSTESPTENANPPPMREVHGLGISTPSSQSFVAQDERDGRRSNSNDGGTVASDLELATTMSKQSHVARVFTAVERGLDYLSNPAADRYDDTDFRSGRANDFPELPGEEHRNPALKQIRKLYNAPREEDGSRARGSRDRSRAPSFTGSVSSRVSGDDGSTTPRAASPQPPHGRRSTFPHSRSSSELQQTSSVPSTGPESRRRRDTLEVPSPTYGGSVRNELSISSPSPTLNMPEGQNSPAIVVSSDLDTSPAHTVILDPSTAALTSEPLPLSPPLPTPSPPLSPPGHHPPKK